MHGVRPAVSLSSVGPSRELARSLRKELPAAQRTFPVGETLGPAAEQRDARTSHASCTRAAIIPSTIFPAMLGNRIGADRQV